MDVKKHARLTKAGIGCHLTSLQPLTLISKVGLSVSIKRTLDHRFKHSL